MSVTILIVYVERGGCEVIGVVVVDVIGIEKNVVCVVSGDACVVFQFPLDSVVQRRSSTRNTKKKQHLILIKFCSFVWSIQPFFFLPIFVLSTYKLLMSVVLAKGLLSALTV
mgnify:CR=1 FL=1